jgi:serine protease Do
MVIAAKLGRASAVVADAGAAPAGMTAFQQATWNAFGLTLEPVSASVLRDRGLPLEGGMRVVSVKPGSSAASQGVVKGDILVQIHRWYTTSEEDVQFILNRADAVAKLGAVRFDIVRGSERFFGQLALGTDTETTRR